MDSIANMLTMIHNAQAASKPVVIAPYSKMKYDIAKIFEKKKFIAGVEKKMKKIKRNAKPRLCLEITLKYVNNKIPAISGYRKISKPGQRIYLAAKEIKKVKQGRGIGVISTSKGLMADHEAKKENIGGELICEIW